MRGKLGSKSQRSRSSGRVTPPTSRRRKDRARGDIFNSQNRDDSSSKGSSRGSTRSSPSYSSPFSRTRSTRERRPVRQGSETSSRDRGARSKVGDGGVGDRDYAADTSSSLDNRNRGPAYTTSASSKSSRTRRAVYRSRDQPLFVRRQYRSGTVDGESWIPERRRWKRMVHDLSGPAVPRLRRRRSMARRRKRATYVRKLNTVGRGVLYETRC